jgi:amidohydrolase
MDIIQQSKQLEKYFVSIREKLHQFPELGLQEYETAKIIREELVKMGYDYERVIETGTIVHINNNASKTIAIRADIDGLNVKENVSVDYKSLNEGYMHACGHDIHTANLLTLAMYLKDNSKKYEANIVLIFQPAEEGPGGAKLILESGQLDKYNISEIHGLHIFPNLNNGTIGYRAGFFFAKNSEIDIEIIGKSSHVAKPKEGINALLAASEIVVRVNQKMQEKKFENSIVHIGKIRSGEIRNSIAGSAQLEGTMRSFDNIQFLKIKEMIEEICMRIEQKFQIKVRVSFLNGYEIVDNDSNLINRYIPKIDSKKQIKAQFLAEDFSFYQTKYRGVFWLFGIGENEPLHSSELKIETAEISTIISFFPIIIEQFCVNE